MAEIKFGCCEAKQAQELIEQVAREQHDQGERMTVFFMVCLLCLFATCMVIIIGGVTEKRTDERLKRLERIQKIDEVGRPLSE